MWALGTVEQSIAGHLRVKWETDPGRSELREGQGVVVQPIEEFRVMQARADLWMRENEAEDMVGEFVAALKSSLHPWVCGICSTVFVSSVMYVALAGFVCPTCWLADHPDLPPPPTGIEEPPPEQHPPEQQGHVTMEGRILAGPWNPATKGDD